jgi:hypothetical protein
LPAVLFAVITSFSVIPKSGSLTSIDFFNIISIGFIFMQLIIIMKINHERFVKRQREVNETTVMKEDNIEDPSSLKATHEKQNEPKLYLLVLPLMFILFLVLYTIIVVALK